MILVRNVKINIKDLDEKDVIKNRLLKKLQVNPLELRSMRILKESLDARKKPDIYMIFSVLVELENENKILDKKLTDVTYHYEVKEEELIRGKDLLNKRPVVIGLGPAGLFAALTLAKEGLRPLVIERGEDVEKRTKSVETFWSGGKLNVNSNVQFGEGGAGTFSDGKLTTRIKDSRVEKVLDILVSFGGDEEIRYRSKPHIGTDVLKGIVANIRKEIIKNGGEVIFSSLMEDIEIRGGKLRSIRVNGQWIECEALILCPGHSSRDTYTMLYKRGVNLEAKAFSLGFRVEHLQEDMDIAQYGKVKSSYLRASEYSLAAKTSSGRGVYSFCMCPGGLVVNASSEEGHLCVNGMSYHARDGRNANSAIVAAIGPEDFGHNALDGMEFQREMERKAFVLGGKDYFTPCQNVRDYLENKISKDVYKVMPTIKPGFTFKGLHDFYPQGINEAIKEAMLIFSNKIKNFHKDGIFTGIETRTSAPLRILRNSNLESVNVEGLYPCGEGAGYAGGIMSAAVDGIKVAEAILKKYSRLKEK